MTDETPQSETVEAPKPETVEAPKPAIAVPRPRTIGWFVPRLQELVRAIPGARNVPVMRALEGHVVSALALAEAEYLKQQIVAAQAQQQAAAKAE